LVALLLVASVIALAVALGIALVLNDGGGSGNAAQPPTGGEIGLVAVGTFDPPPGDGGEHDADAPLATDGNEATFWRTDGYRYPNGGLGKPGVGLVLDAGKVVTLHKLTVTTDTPGFAATIRAGDGAGGSFHDVSGSQITTASTTFELQNGDARYFVVWITNLGNVNRAHVNEVVGG
jgi:eukaryotic-like serine/threonine-protein kinase